MFSKFLPLSWTSVLNKKESAEKTSLSFSRSAWLYYANLPYPEQTSESIFTGKENIFVRGLNKNHISLVPRPFESLYFGKEAVLNLSFGHFDKKSLKELVKRGKRHGSTVELKYSQESVKLLEDFKKKCAHYKEPQLRYLFQDKFSHDERLFLFRNEKTIYGAIVLSENSGGKVHTELILRRNNSPIGVMEALIHDLFYLLKKENKARYLSLGEVPFIYMNEAENLKNKFVLMTGRGIKFVYNYKGLYKFKNKFNPVWENVYIAETGRIRYTTLAGVAIKSNLLKLAFYKVKKLLFYQ